MSNLLAKWAVKKSKISKMGIVMIKIDYLTDQNPQSCLICLATSRHILMYNLYQGTNKLNTIIAGENSKN